MKTHFSQNITLENWIEPENNRWAFRHTCDLISTEVIARGSDTICEISKNFDDFGAVEFTKSNGCKTDVESLIRESFTDGFLVLHRGVAVHETLCEGFDRSDRHIVFSITKSVVGMLAGILVHQGLFSRNDLASDFIPELDRSGWAGATIGNILDMTSGVDFQEDYQDRSSKYWELRRALYHQTDEAGERTFEGILDFLPSIGTHGSHGREFNYQSVETLVLCWIIERTTGRRLAGLIESEIWSKLGAEHDGYIMLDPKGVAYGAGGLCTSVWDLARFGQMVANYGSLNGAQIVPEEWVVQCSAGDPRTFERSTYAKRIPNGAYKNQWWIKDSTACQPMALGIHGQMIYIDRAKDMVGVKMSSWPAARQHEMLEDTISAFEAIAESL